MGLQPNPNRFNLEDGESKRMEDVELVLLAKGHDVEDADAQWADVLPLRPLRGNPAQAVLLDNGERVVILTQNQGHRIRSEKEANPQMV